MKQSTAKLTFLKNLSSYRCLTTKQSAAAGVATEQMTRRYSRQLCKEGLLRIMAWQIQGNSGRPESLMVPTTKGLKIVGAKVQRPIEQRCYAHQYHVNSCRIQLAQMRPDVGTRFWLGQLSVDNQTFWPDGIIVLRSISLNKSLLCFLEVDMGTESVTSKSKLESVLHGKVLLYRSLFLSGGYKKLANNGESFRGFRLLFVFSEKKKLQTFVRFCQQLEPCPFVWSTDFVSFNDKGAGAYVWYKGGFLGETVSILGALAQKSCDTPLIKNKA